MSGAPLICTGIKVLMKQIASFTSLFVHLQLLDPPIIVSHYHGRTLVLYNRQLIQKTEQKITPYVSRLTQRLSFITRDWAMIFLY